MIKYNCNCCQEMNMIQKDMIKCKINGEDIICNDERCVLTNHLDCPIGNGKYDND